VRHFAIGSRLGTFDLRISRFIEGAGRSAGKMGGILVDFSSVEVSIPPAGDKPGLSVSEPTRKERRRDVARHRPHRLIGVAEPTSLRYAGAWDLAKPMTTQPKPAR